MRVVVLAAFLLAGCATSPATSDVGSALTKASIADLSSRGEPTTSVVRIQAGTVRVRHSIPVQARLRETRLQGLDPTNRHLTYVWVVDGTFTVEESGRYRHSVSGSIIGGGRERLRSTLTYTELREPGGTQGPDGQLTRQVPGIAAGGRGDLGVPDPLRLSRRR